jgi:hypothetical protein
MLKFKKALNFANRASLPWQRTIAIYKRDMPGIYLV